MGPSGQPVPIDLDLSVTIACQRQHGVNAIIEFHSCLCHPGHSSSLNCTASYTPARGRRGVDVKSENARRILSHDSMVTTSITN